MKKIICLLVFIFSSSVQAMPVGFNFHQHGFEEGAFVTGMFYGDDLDGNGQLSSFAGEVSDFMMAFSGNSLVVPFALGFPDLFGLVYDLDGGPLGDGVTLDIEGIGADSGLFIYLAGPGPIPAGGEVSDGTGVSFSPELVIVTPKSVPEPVSIALLTVALAGISFSRFKKSI